MQRNACERSHARWGTDIGRRCLIAYLSLSTLITGCRFPYTRSWSSPQSHLGEYRTIESDIALQTENPDTSLPTADCAANTPEPRTILTDLPEDDDSKYWDVTLQEAIHYGLTNSRVLNDLGGTILRTPDIIGSNLNPAIIQTDPRFGIEGALSAFDARLNVTNNLENNDQALNNLFLSGGNTGRTFTQTLDTNKAELVKQTVTGGSFALRNVTIYDKNSAPANLFPYSFTTYYEAEARQALLQGGGVEFNRIAGPNGLPGYYNGVKIARLRADISQAEFEVQLRDYLSNLENAYWDLHFAYRDLASKVELRDLALEVYGLYDARIKSGFGTDEKFRLAQVREQYYRFQEEVQNTLTGRRIDGTRTNNGTIPGTFRSGSGVYLAERRLRLLMGVPTSDNRLIRPTTEATKVEVNLDWEVVKNEALTRRPELHRQKFRVKKAELELFASRNYLKPRLDLVGKYRMRGFGENLIGYNNNPYSNDPPDRFANAYSNLMTGQFQESQVGVEFSMPVGFRQGNAAVAQAEFVVARERAVLFEQERQVIHDVGNAVADISRSFEVTKTAEARRNSAAEYLEGLTNKIRTREFGASQLEQWLEAQRRFAEADTQFHLALSEHQIALKNVNYEKGSLLDYCNIQPVDGMTSTTPEINSVNQTSHSSLSSVKATSDLGVNAESSPAVVPTFPADPSDRPQRIGMVDVEGDEAMESEEEEFTDE